MRHFRASNVRKVSLLMVSVAGIGLLATSALAAPTSVIALGGNVDSGKYYDVDEAVPTNPSSAVRRSSMNPLSSSTSIQLFLSQVTLP